MSHFEFSFYYAFHCGISCDCMDCNLDWSNQTEENHEWLIILCVWSGHPCSACTDQIKSLCEKLISSACVFLCWCDEGSLVRMIYSCVHAFYTVQSFAFSLFSDCCGLYLGPSHWSWCRLVQFCIHSTLLSVPTLFKVSLLLFSDCCGLIWVQVTKTGVDLCSLVHIDSA